jgi:hypothetical protein
MTKNNKKKEIALCESSLNKMIIHAIHKVLKEQQINEKEVEKFTPYEKGSGPERFKKAFYSGSATSRNPSYAAALKNKNLDEAISKAIKKVIKENYDDDQLRLWKMAQEYLEKAGYPTWGGYRNNPYVLRVSINDFSDVNKIDSMLTKLFGINDISDLNVNHESNMFGNDQRAVIYLPSVNKTKFAQGQTTY